MLYDDVLRLLWLFWLCLWGSSSLKVESAPCFDLLLSQFVSHVCAFASPWVIGSWLAAVFFAVCMASVPEATNPLRYSPLDRGPAALPSPVVCSLLLTRLCPTLCVAARLTLSGSWARTFVKWQKQRSPKLGQGFLIKINNRLLLLQCTAVFFSLCFCSLHSHVYTEVILCSYATANHFLRIFNYIILMKWVSVT